MYFYDSFIRDGVILSPKQCGFMLVNFKNAIFSKSCFLSDGRGPDVQVPILIRTVSYRKECVHGMAAGLTGLTRNQHGIIFSSNLHTYFSYAVLVQSFLVEDCS